MEPQPGEVDRGSQETESGAYALPENNNIKNENMKRMLAKYGEAARRGLASGPAYESADVPDHAYIDGYNTRLAIATMKEMVENADKPFFLGTGIQKAAPELVAPKKYWDLYDPEKIPLATQVDSSPGRRRNGAARLVRTANTCRHSQDRADRAASWPEH